MMTIPAPLVIAVFAVHAAAAHGIQRSSSSSPSSSLIPYIPTTILIPGSTTGTVDTTDTNENSTAYIFSPNKDGDAVALLSVDITSTLNITATSSDTSSAANTLTSALPFVSSSNTSTFVPSLALDGSIIVFAGDCTSDTASQIWIYNTSTGDSASWVQYGVSSSSTTGPYFLGGGLAFSDIISPSLSTPSIYAYGGQCPDASLADNDAADEWVSAAEYTNTMVKLSPPSSSSDNNDAYSPESLSLKSQPIAEAGFSFTSLPPSTSNISGTITQTINAVVLGGHTQSAFVNMSTAAVWSLPEESWSFISISGPFSSSSSSDTSELARNDETFTSVNSRSGHTAVLNEEGTALIVLGGWVGNTSQPATPQLAVLEMNGSEYGQWTWTVPQNQPLGNGDGIYGHGAALLPGNIMMISGGYSISSLSSSSSKLRPRTDISVAGGQLKSFLDINSMTWSDSYTNPSSSGSSSPTSSTADTSTASANRLGLGLGLGLGLPILLFLLAMAFFCIRRRRRYSHSVRDEHMRNLASGNAFITSEEMLERHDTDYLWGGAAGAARWYYSGGHDPYVRDEKSLGYESLRRGSSSGGAGPQSVVELGEEPIMAVEPVAGYKNALRRKPAPRVAKGLYQPTGVDESRSLGVIHPILEDEEDELSQHDPMSPDKELEGEGGCEGEEDPFMTPTPSPDRERATAATGGHTSMYRSDSPGPSSPVEPRTPVRPQHPEVQDWVTDIDASDALITARIQGRGTTTTAARTMGRAKTPPPPTRRQSLREDDNGGRTDSNLSESNRSAFSFMPNRADSLRVGAATGSTPAWLTTARENTQEKRGGTSHSDHSSNSNSNSNTSYTTAKSISALQSEGPTLLLGRPRAISGIYDVADEDPGSPSKNKPPRRSWFGSLRRVFSNGHGSGSSSSTSVRTESPHAQGETSDYDRLGLGSLGLGGIGMLQKRRQGRSAWDTTTGEAGALRGNSWEAGDEDEEDWDIERAVEQRLVQVMFSVPKERLRIVNGDPEILSLAESAVMVDLADVNGTAATIHNSESKLDALGENPLSPVQEDETALEKGKQSLDQVPAPIPIRPMNDSPPQVLETRVGSVQEKEEVVQDHNDPEQPRRAETPSSTTSSKRPVLLLQVPPLEPSSEVRSATGSPASKIRSLTPSPGIPMTAEEIRFERPRSRVLALVEQLEERSRSNSPSPTKRSFR